MSANERGTRGIWVIARRVAAPLIALLIGAAAMALLLDSGTTHLPSIGTRSGSPPPPEKIVVSAPATSHATHHRAVVPTTHATPTQPAGGTTS
ncbi:MAG: hypothetical protein ACXVRQ_10070, partial [Gaiellaceae bacterium]